MPQPRRLNPASHLLRIVAALAALLLAFPAQADPFSEKNTNRPGSDISSFAIPHQSGFATEETLCRSACQDNGSCMAWTLVKPGVQQDDAVCWLKEGIPGKQRDSCCTSGVVLRGAQVDLNLPGGDYRDFHASGAKECARTCEGEDQCVAWTIVPSMGIDSGLSAGQCWLKSSVPDAVRDGCCISGLSDHFRQPN